MKRSLIQQGKVTDHFKPAGTFNEEDVRRRAGELATIDGRGPDDINEADRRRARREVQGLGINAEPIAEGSDLLDESEPDAGARAPTRAVDDEQTVAEGLFEEGVQEAEQEQMTQAEEAARDKEPRE